MSETRNATTAQAEQLVKATHPEAETDAFIEDDIFFLTAKLGERSASHAYTMDNRSKPELQAARDDVVERVLAELAKDAS